MIRSLVLLLGWVVGCSPQLSGLYTGPYFSLYTAGNVTIQAGEVARLPCRVHQVRNYSVSWVRTKDSAILSIDGETVVQDARVTVVRHPARGDWLLSISDVRGEDEGQYECQVSMSRKLSMFVHLSVLVPWLEVEGPAEVFTERGSTVQLSCTLAHSPEHHSPTWLQDGEEVLEEGSEVEVSRRGGNTTVLLTLHQVSLTAAGLYTCTAAGLSSSNITLHVIDVKEQGLRTNEEHRVLSSKYLTFIIVFAKIFITF